MFYYGRWLCAYCFQDVGSRPLGQRQSTSLERKTRLQGEKNRRGLGVDPLRPKNKNVFFARLRNFDNRCGRGGIGPADVWICCRVGLDEAALRRAAETKSHTSDAPWIGHNDSGNTFGGVDSRLDPVWWGVCGPHYRNEPSQPTPRVRTGTDCRSEPA